MAETSSAVSGETFQVITEDFVNVFISSNCKSFVSEKKFPKGLTLASLRGKLELISGGSANGMKISVFDKYDNKVCDLDGDDSALLGSFPVDSGMRLHVVDTSKTLDEFENLASVEKFELSKEDYAKRDNTVQSFLKRNKLGKYNEEEMKRLEDEKTRIEQEEEEAAKLIGVGSRCEARVPGNMARRGKVEFVGKVHFKPGWWIGIRYDEPLGKNDGSVGGKRYFDCPDKYGGFVKPEHCVVGDFPEEELMSDDEI